VRLPHRLATALLAVACLIPHASCDSAAGAGAHRAVPSADPGPSAGDPPSLPVGHRGGWTPAFSDEFAGTSLDPQLWADRSSAEPDEGRGNLGNQQLEWNQAQNCSVGAGELVMTARREPVTSRSGNRYAWTSCLITSTPSYTFQYGYLEERSILPAPRGFWPAFWTWQARVVERHTETDVYEFFSDNHRRMYGMQFSGAQGQCRWQPPFDPTEDWHTYGAAIEPSGTTWYADGVEVCRVDATSDGPTNIISNLAVYSVIPPEDSTTSATKRVDYIRAWAAS
jgi:beta-glucanase (GH16 family)